MSNPPKTISPLVQAVTDLSGLLCTLQVGNNVVQEAVWLGGFSIKLGTPFLCTHFVLLVLSLVDVLPLMRRLD
jgi:hypothetical protein